MAVKPTYLNIAHHAWKLIEQINRGHAATSLTAFLGPTGTAIVAPHFPANWLNRIKICVQTPVPTPDLDSLWRNMGYADLNAFELACGGTHASLFSVLQAFSHGAGFAGIAYDTTIYLSAAKSDELALSVHELVHTLQWDYFSPVLFLEKYIRGFTANFPRYQNNPAETRAYYFENQFRSRVSGLGAFAAGAGLVSIWKKAIANTPPMQTARTQLTSMRSLNITTAVAVQGM